MNPKLVRRKRRGFGLAAPGPGSQKASERAELSDIPDDPVRMALLRDYKERLRKLAPEAKREAEKEARKKAALHREILTVRQKLNREASKGCTAKRRKKKIAHELDILRRREFQECGTHLRKHPSTRPSAKELRFKTAAPSVDEILAAAAIQHHLHLKKPELLIARLAENNPEWDEIAKCEAQDNPKIEQARKRIKYGAIKGIAEGKWSNTDRVIAGHYFKSPILKKPLRELSADEAAPKLRKLDVEISPRQFEQALRRLHLVD